MKLEPNMYIRTHFGIRKIKISQDTKNLYILINQDIQDLQMLINLIYVLDVRNFYKR